MKNWSDEFSRLLAGAWGETPGVAFLQRRYDWVTCLHARARTVLSPENLRRMPPAAVYDRLRELGVPQCPIRVAHLGRANRAADIVEALLALMETPGDFEGKYRAAKFPQAGMVTITTLLCVARPRRFALRSVRFHRALAKVVPFYTARGLAETGYGEFLDMCRELARVMETTCARAGAGEWAREHRFLLLYAVVTDSGSRSGRGKAQT